MNKQLYIHIGGMKTGTTALQIFCAKNRQALEAQGFCYPGKDAAHWNICADIQDYSAGRLRFSSSTAVHRFIAEIQRSSCHTGILSGECLSFFGGAGALRDLIPRSIPVTVVYYARRQDTLIESFYLEQVKSRHYRMKNRLDEGYVKDVSRENLCDHSRVIRPWAEAFGKDNVLVRCYENKQLGGDIIGDFTGIIGLIPDQSFSRPKEQSNTRMDLPHTEFMRLCYNAFPDSLAVSRFLIANRCHRSRIFENYPKQNLLSPKTRIGILEYYEESNRSVAREYLGRQDGRLFYDPWPDPDEPWESYPGLTIDELGRIVDELITNTDRLQNPQEPQDTLLWKLNTAIKKGIRFVPEPVRRAIAAKVKKLSP